MAYSKVSIRELYERHFKKTFGPHDKVQVMSRRPAACFSEEEDVHVQCGRRSLCDGQACEGAEKQRVCPPERPQRDAPLYHPKALYLYNRHYVSPARQRVDLRSCGKTSSLPSGHCSHCRSPSTSCYIPVQPNTSTKQPEKRRPPKDLAGGVKDASPHASAPANKTFSGLGKNPDLVGEPKHVQTPEERCVRAITSKAKEIEQLYTEDCKTFGLVVKMLISKDQTLERRLLSALKKNLVDIRKQSLKDLRQFISNVTSRLKPEQSAKLYRNINKRRFRRTQHI
ncbi:periphilin-1 isoform X2 [Triplophysa rosa]|uniref:periphilin-1 isoform X2 n=1 Tax=Triplophysa rosa TaxID=992332 RepID=UPI0025461512|nr:periphilin-1 isoform X2 [Triplophysa rosa]